MTQIARLGEGKWHTVAASGEGVVFTACSNQLRPFKSSLRSVTIEIKDGDPTCKLCVGTRKAQP